MVYARKVDEALRAAIGDRAYILAVVENVGTIGPAWTWTPEVAAIARSAQEGDR